MPTANDFPQAAHATLVARLHAPVFFDKLARDYNIIPASDEERQGLLELASVLQAKKASDQAQKAASGRGLVFEALNGVKQALAADGVLPAQSTAIDQQIKSAADYAAQDPQLAEAASAYAEYLAAQGQ